MIDNEGNNDDIYLNTNNDYVDNNILNIVREDRNDNNEMNEEESDNEDKESNEESLRNDPIIPMNFKPHNPYNSKK